jgi:hypothetical protein
MKIREIIKEQADVAANLAVIKSLINPQAQQNFAKIAQRDPAAAKQSQSRQGYYRQSLSDLEMWEDPLGIIQQALNVGIAPEEIAKIIPQDMDLRTVPKLGTMSQRNQALLKR